MPDDASPTEDDPEAGPEPPADGDPDADGESPADPDAGDRPTARDADGDRPTARDDGSHGGGPDAAVAGVPAQPEAAEDGSAEEIDEPADADAPESADGDEPSADDSATPRVPEDVRKYDRFQKMDGAQYDRVNEFLRDRTYITAREWAMARLCADFRTETGVEMTKIGENLPVLVPFMTDQYSPQAVNQARSAFEEKVHKAGATFLYGAMSDFFTADELDDLMYEVTEVAKFLLEVEGVDLSVEEELEAEERISSVMREVRRSSDELRHEGVECPECGHEIGGTADD